MYSCTDASLWLWLRFIFGLRVARGWILLGPMRVRGVFGHLFLRHDAILAHASDADSAIVALTHDPRIDDMGLLEALETEAFYIGAMGSKKSSEARRGRLSALGLSDAQIGKLRAPVGLAIGSKTPAEIAVAILADLISVSRTAFTSTSMTTSSSITNPAISTAP